MELNYSTSRPATTKHLLRTARGVWIAILIAISIRAGLQPHRQTVQDVFLYAAHDFSVGRSIYTSHHYDYRYSPAFAVSMIPLAKLPDRASAVVWRLLNAAVFLAALFWCCRLGIPRPMSTLEISLLFLLVAPLLIGNLNVGQSNPMVLGLMLASIAACLGRRWTLAAFCITIATLLKVYPLALGLLLILLYPKKLSWRLAFLLLLGFAFPYAFQKSAYVTQQYHQWLHYLRVEDRTQSAIIHSYRDLRLLFKALHIPLSPIAYITIQLLVAAAIAAVALVGRLRRWPEAHLLAMLLSLACCWMTVLGPATESQTYMLLALAAAWPLLDAFARHQPFPRRIAAILIYALLLLAQIAIWHPRGRSFVAYTNPQPIAALLLVAYWLRSSFNITPEVDRAGFRHQSQTF